MERVKKFDEAMMIILVTVGLLLCILKFFVGYDNDVVAGMYGGIQLVEIIRCGYLYYIEKE